MAVSSALNPGSIVKERSSSAEGAKNFLTGGSTLGSGVVAGAANKIVQFSRSSAAGVAAKPPDLQSMISTLSTNILNNVQNQVSSINQNVTQFVQQKLGEIQQNYRSRIDKIDAARPNSILNNFLSLYKEAIGYIQFLGNPRNVKTLRKNLVGLQEVFRQTFKVARLIRSTIIKIVQQLSGLPQASTGPGGINLDINVPGGPLKKMMPRGVRRMLRNPAVMMGGAALAGGLGSRVVSGMLDVGDGSVDAAPMSEGTIPTALLDRFSGILDVFSQAIKNFSRGSQTSQTQASSSGSSASPSPSSPNAPGAGPSPSTGVTGDVSGITSDSAEEARIAAALVTEGGGGTAATDILQVAANRIASGNYGSTYTDVFAAPNQFQGVFDNPRGGTEGYRNIQNIADAATWAGVSEDVIKSRIADMRNPQLRADSAQFVGGALEFRAAPGYYLRTGLVPGEMGSDGRFYNSSWRGGGGDNQFLKDPNKDPTISGPATVSYAGMTSLTTRPQTEATPTVTPAPNQAQGNQAAAQSVAQPPGRPPVETAVVPLSTNDQSSQSTPPVNKSSPPPKLASQGADSVPFFTASNDDNFLSLYSRLTYNIVDG